MKKNKFIICFLILSILITFVSCNYNTNSDTSPTYDNTNNTTTSGTNQDEISKTEPTEPPTVEVDFLTFEFDKYNVNISTPQKLNLLTAPSDVPLDQLEFSSSDDQVATIDDNGVITFLSHGEVTVTATSQNEITAQAQVSSYSKLPTSYTIQDVPHITQVGIFPTGCEIVSTTMLLNHYGYNTTVEYLIDNYLPMESIYVNNDGYYEGPDPESCFLGSPYSYSSFGCYAPVIEYTLNDYLSEEGNKHISQDVTEKTLDELVAEYIVNDIPVVIWSTMYMADPFNTTSWTVSGARDYSSYEDGDTFTWLANEHCIVLVGYDENYYYYNDPMYSYGYIKADKSLFETRYEQLGSQAVVLKNTV